MQIKKMTGYMLGNSNHVVARGDQWCGAGVPVYVCASKEMAYAVLEHSQRETLEPHIVWTTIYRVHANDIDIDKIEHNLMWTHQGNKIIVDTPVMHREPIAMSEQRLLQNAAQIRQHFAKLMQQNWIKEMRR